MSAKRRGFTLVEIMVAITISAALFGICVAIYINVSKFKSRSEKLLFLHETARGINNRLGRDLEGLHVADTDDDGDTELADYWKLEPGAMGGAGDRLTFLAAVENPGKVDYCPVAYYVQNGKLYREISDTMGGVAPGGGWPAKADCVLANGIERLSVVTNPATPAAGKLPATVTVTVKLADPGGRPAFRWFTVTLRPGSEEN